ncbi:hypothetical protein AB0756_09075 [Tolypothrix campylonemoides VB511288_2]|uniref:Uncharacterized protein n=2 Tax=Tolypothrix TaxID=111782 RepID=A0A8S9SXB5_9CYAN|nr:hypothetical protein [Tolypothrix bouteillei]KAF3884725.1 hypothetical protein DA73_0400003995 [Tolypothrix bouteillei VB521301]
MDWLTIFVTNKVWVAYNIGVWVAIEICGEVFHDDRHFEITKNTNRYSRVIFR